MSLSIAWRGDDYLRTPPVRTPMTAPTKIYDSMPLLKPEQAADMIVQACVEKPVRVATRLGIFGEILHAVAPRITQIVMNTTFRMFPDSAASIGAKPGDKPGAKPKLSAEAMALAQMMRRCIFRPDRLRHSFGQWRDRSSSTTAGPMCYWKQWMSPDMKQS